MRWLLSAALIGILAGADVALADGMIRATCTVKGGVTVHRQDLPEDVSATDRLAVATAFPDAMCVFLKVSGQPPEVRSIPSGASEILVSTDGASIDVDESLAAALSVLSGTEISSDESTRSFANSFATPMSRSAPERRLAKPLNLTVGIYRSMPMSDVMAHWRSMQAGTKILSRMTPSMSVVGEVTMLSIENVPDAEAAGLCEEASDKGAGCLAVY